jgi:hypothetical protein
MGQGNYPCFKGEKYLKQQKAAPFEAAFHFMIGSDLMR